MAAPRVWTPEKEAELSRLMDSGETLEAAALAFGVTLSAIRNHLWVMKHPKMPPLMSRAAENLALRQRWNAMLPGMKAALRDDILREGLDIAPPVVP